jgi:predicted metal-binding membrane protein
MADHFAVAWHRERLRGIGSIDVAAAAATLGLAVTCWVLAVEQMAGMDMGVGTQLGSFASFVAVWTSMMAAMMLPSAVPAVVARARLGGWWQAVPVFVISYLAVWLLVGVALYPAYRPHGTAVAAALVVAAGGYELTPLKRYCRRRCQADTGSGFTYGLSCVGSSVGLMGVLLALGIMSLTWMVVVTVVVLAQKLMVARPAVDLTLALALIGLGAVVATAPSLVPGITPSM